MGELIQFVPRSTATTGRDALPEHIPENTTFYRAGVDGRTMVLSTLQQKIADARRAHQFETSARSLPSALHLPWTSGKPRMTAIFEDTAPCECNPSPENLA